MRRQRNFLPFIALAAAVATPALGQTGTSGRGLGSGETNSAASIPDFSRIWRHPSFPWFEPPASGPGPRRERSSEAALAVGVRYRVALLRPIV